MNDINEHTHVPPSAIKHAQTSATPVECWTPFDQTFTHNVFAPSTGFMIAPARSFLKESVEDVLANQLLSGYGAGGVIGRRVDSAHSILFCRTALYSNKRKANVSIR